MKTSDFNYDLPPELIAQHPLPERAASRMLVVHRARETIEHRTVSDLPAVLQAGDLAVFNDTRVMRARLYGHKRVSGGRVEVLLLEEIRAGTWRALLHASRPARVDTELVLADGELIARIAGVGDRGEIDLELTHEGDLAAILGRHGVLPLPPYIRREAVADDDERYQTVYADQVGAVAAPTAGLHFTPRLLEALQDRGVDQAFLTLHVGWGTFQPVRVEDPSMHRMDEERFEVPPETEHRVNTVRSSGGRVMAVGTTTVRTLETAGRTGAVVAGAGRSDLFIHPPYAFRIVDILLTNFHLPGSTLLMLVGAFTGRELLRRAYDEAIGEKYRFYSYGDCMLILP